MNRSAFPRAALVAALTLLSPAVAHAQDDDEPEYRPGLVATFTAVDKSCTRLDADVAFDWQTAAPDPRIPAGKFKAKWTGRLFTITPGDYQLHAYAVGAVKIELAGQVVLNEKIDGATFLTARAVKLEYGHHPVTIEYGKQGDAARLAMFWEGPKFQLEPIPPRHLFHDPKDAPNQDFERGQLLARALRCGACHDLPGGAPIAGPSLASAGKLLDAAWLENWLAAAPPAADAEIARRMPHLGLSRDEAKDLTSYLQAEAQAPREPKIEPDPAPPKKKDGDKDNKKDEPKKPKASAELGATLLRTVGCLACHQSGGVGTAGLFGGGDLSEIAGKRPREFFAGWLADPAAFNTAHRMPVFRLSSVERESLALHLATLRAKDSKEAKVSEKEAKSGDKASIERGRKLALEHRCATCHTLPGKEAPPQAPLATRIKIRPGQPAEASCLAAPDVAKKRPGYHLGAKDAAALTAYLKAPLPPAGTAKSPADGAFVLAERQCLSCHAREPTAGIAPQLAKVVALDGELAAQLPALAPPALNGVGDKLHEEWLLSAIESKQPLRPWLRIRMPRFALDTAEKDALLAYFVSHDRIPDRPTRPLNVPTTSLQVGGSRLVTADGFGCTSCHQVGSSIPHQVALNAHGTDLSMIGKRIRPSWYDRWVRDPARIVPRMEMPSVKLPVRGVLGEDLDTQLAAVWHVVNQPGFEPPLPNPIRTVRASGLAAEAGGAEKLTRANSIADVVVDGKKSWLKPLVVGLPNRHNLLFDLERGQLAGWWIGDTARQRTRGKSWLWEPGGTHVWPLAERDTELRLDRDGATIAGKIVGQFTAELDSIEHVPGGIACEYRRHNLNTPKNEVRVRQTWTALAAEATASGFRREFAVSGLGPADQFVIRVAPVGGYRAAGPGVIHQEGTPAAIEIRLVEPKGLALRPGDAQLEPSFTLEADAQGNARAVLEYRTALPVDRYLPTDVTVKPRAPIPLDVVPGYQAVEIPLTEQVMPTGMAWMNDGTLAVCSLKGEVWLALDRDGDKLPDTWRQFSDDLATPYGIAVPPETKGTIDVITKTGLLRLVDRDGDGRADRTQVLAAGWGHTDDYHDWAVGLERDWAGGYYVALPCEQDNRSEAAAYLRGKLLRISPPEQKREFGRWKIDEICGGLRFPMGLAVNRDGAIFASDNQGNYNPFNELNHLMPGKRYGFINSFEKKQKLAPPLEEPAINIPHPWTRSVNGICFLETPAAIKKQTGRDVFGPFEGHLLGCEYDTQRLVRMSLEKIGETYQGAAYPLSSDPKKGARGLEGPVVAAVAPDGDIYVGNMRDSGWGAGANVGSIVRLRPAEKLPLGIAEVRSTPKGLAVTFTGPVDAEKASDAATYAVEAYRRVSTPAYGGPDVDRHAVKVVSAQLDSDARRAVLVLDDFREGFVYELRVKSLAVAGEEFFPAEAHYTLRKRPE